MGLLADLLVLPYLLLLLTSSLQVLRSLFADIAARSNGLV